MCELIYNQPIRLINETVDCYNVLENRSCLKYIFKTVALPFNNLLFS
jgi:hypothetical protein